MLKKFIVGSPMGQAALTLRAKLELRSMARAGSEQTGLKVNDMTARRLRDALCAEGKTFVDVGAHIGSVLGGVLANSRPGRIIAVEAIPDKAAHLRKAFGTVDIVECAVGPQTGEVEFTIDTAASGYSSLDPAVRDRVASFKVITVQMRPLDDILPKQGVDIMKIDIEGAELGALQGAEMVIAGSRPVVVFESGIHDMQGYTKKALFAWFSEHDYAIFAPIRVAHEAPSMTLDIYLDAHEYPRTTTDFFAIPFERVIEIRERARRILQIKT